MFPFIRRIVLISTPLKSFGSVSQNPLKSHRLLSSSSDIVSYPDKPATVFLENYGFSKLQISTIVKKFPQIVSAKPEISVFPKLLFFQSKGLSSPEVTKLVSRYPYILVRSLNKQIIPSFDYFHELFQSEEKTIATIEQLVGILRVNFQTYVRPNIELMRQFGVPKNNIESFIILRPRLFTFKPIRFKERVEEAQEMGFNPLRYTFVVAVSALLQLSKSTWKKKVEVYRKWGCSEDELLSAFRKHPACMLASEDKINGVLDYFVNEIGCGSSFVTRNPSLLCLSLKRRVVPRGSVYLLLSSKGLIKKDVNRRLFTLTDKRFIDKFIKPYEKDISGLLKLYKEKLKVSEGLMSFNV